MMIYMGELAMPYKCIVFQTCSCFYGNRYMRRFAHLASLLLVMAVLISIALPVRAADTFTMAFGYDPAQEPLYKFFELLYTEAFHRLGFKFAYTIFPLKRCSVTANDGKVDGEPQRVYNYGKDYPNLIRVDEVIFINRSMAFATNPAIRLDGWDSLKDTTYRVEYLRGALRPEQELPQRVKPELLSSITTDIQALR